MPFTNPPPPVQSITIPTGATTGPRIVIGNTIPPELVAYGASVIPVITFTSVVLYYTTTTDYYWQAVGFIGASPAEFTGIFESVGGVYVITLIKTANAATLTESVGPLGGVRQHELSYIDTSLIVSGFSTNNSFMLVGGVGSGATKPRVCAARDFAAGALTVQTTISAAFVTIPGAPTISSRFPNAYVDSLIACTMHMTAFGTVAGDKIEIGLTFTSPLMTTFTVTVASLSFNPINTHLQLSGVAYCTTAQKSTYAVPQPFTVTPVWRRAAGTGTISCNTDDRISFEVKEVTPA